MESELSMNALFVLRVRRSPINGLRLLAGGNYE